MKKEGKERIKKVRREGTSVEDRVEWGGKKKRREVEIKQKR